MKRSPRPLKKETSAQKILMLCQKKQQFFNQNILRITWQNQFSTQKCYQIKKLFFLAWKLLYFSEKLIYYTYASFHKYFEYTFPIFHVSKIWKPNKSVNLIQDGTSWGYCYIYTQNSLRSATYVLQWWNLAQLYLKDRKCILIL